MQSNVNLSVPGTNVRLGDRVKDAITGFTGIATAYCRNLTGCDDILITTEVSKDQPASKSAWYHVMRVQVIDSNAVGATPIPTDIPPAG